MGAQNSTYILIHVFALPACTSIAKIETEKLQKVTGLSKVLKAGVHSSGIAPSPIISVFKDVEMTWKEEEKPPTTFKPIVQHMVE